VRSAQQLGTITVLYPDECDRATQIPWFLQAAIEHALTILNWFENLPKNEVPPKHVWADPDGLELWWKKIEERRSEGLPARPESDDDDGEVGTDNDLTRALRR
jgi:hypothetical protein